MPPPPRQRYGRVAFADIAIDQPLFAVSDQALAESWKPEAVVVRLGREWRVSRPTQLADGQWYGRLGYTQKGRLATLDYDDALLDFVEGTASTGQRVPFVIDTERGRIAYQIRPPLIRPHSFTYALRDLLNLGGSYQWVIRPFTRKETYPDWLVGVSRVTAFQIEIRQPNPNWVGREEVLSLMTQLNVRTMELEGVAAEDSVDGVAGRPLFRQLMDHVILGYGDASLQGVGKDQTPLSWLSDGGGSVPTSIRVRADSSGEVDQGDLAKALEQAPVEPEADGDDETSRDAAEPG